MEVAAPSQALLWKKPLTEVTSIVSVKLAVVGLRMMLRTEENPLRVCVCVCREREAKLQHNITILCVIIRNS